MAAREEIVAKVEALANGDLNKVMWKQVSATLTELFEAWQAAQKNGPRLSKTESNDLWKRFRDARQQLDQQSVCNVHRERNVRDRAIPVKRY